MPVEFQGRGVIPACLMPATTSREIDRDSYRRHLGDLADVVGLSGVVVNGHAAEAHALATGEQIWGIETAAETVGDRLPVIAGIYCEGTRLASQMARSAEKAGAQALLIFPPNSLMFGGNERPSLGAQYVKDIAAVTSLPLVVFQYPRTTALSYALDTLVSLCEAVETIVAIKDLCADPRLHERTITALHGLSRPVHVLTSQSQWLGASLSMGARGIISGAGSVIADRQRALFDTFAREDSTLEERRALMQTISLFVDALYRPPYVNWQARMKRILYEFGRLESPNVFAPLQEIDTVEWMETARLISQAGLSRDSLYSM